MNKAEALDILKVYRMELNTALDDVDGIPVILDALDVAIEVLGARCADCRYAEREGVDDPYIWCERNDGYFTEDDSCSNFKEATDA